MPGARPASGAPVAGWLAAAGRRSGITRRIELARAARAASARDAAPPARPAVRSRRRRPRPADRRPTSGAAAPARCSSCFSVTLSCSWRAGLGQQLAACARCSSRWRSRRWRRIRARALPVTTNRSHSGDGVPLLAGDDLDLVAVLQLGAQLHHAAVDLGADAAVADLRMHGIGEVDRRGAARQGDQIALGREAEHLVLEHLQLGVLEEILRVRPRARGCREARGSSDTACPR